MDEGFTTSEIQPKEEPVIMITEPKVTHEPIGDWSNSFGMVDKYDYSESHVIYKGLDLGSFEELVRMKTCMLNEKENLYLEEILNEAIYEYLDSGYYVDDDYVITLRGLLCRLGLKETKPYDKWFKKKEEDK